MNRITLIMTVGRGDHTLQNESAASASIGSLRIVRILLVIQMIISLVSLFL